ncbi:MAG TPA: Mbeg1-like protein [Pyrinomonadaceae bacterium]|nr:Mbeg1-like protein [Pyrinomonadaceae bacterium]
MTAAGFNRVTHPGNPNPPAAQGLKFSETKSAAGLAYDAEKGEIYTFPDGKRWQVVDVGEDNKTGFRAIALRPQDASDNRVIVAFAGTRDGKDWKNNIGQGLGLPTRQYTQAVQFADKWKATGGGNVILTGHSLGGGLASYASVKTGLRDTAVNSAPLALNHLGLNPRVASRITQYYVPGEALSILNAKNPLDIRPGNQIAVQGKNSILDPRSPISNHSLDSVAPNIPAPVKVD